MLSHASGSRRTCAASRGPSNGHGDATAPRCTRSGALDARTGAHFRGGDAVASVVARLRETFADQASAISYQQQSTAITDAAEGSREAAFYNEL